MKMNLPSGYRRQVKLPKVLNWDSIHWSHITEYHILRAMNMFGSGPAMSDMTVKDILKSDDQCAE